MGPDPIICTLDHELTVRPEHLVPGASVLADLTCTTMSVGNLLYLLLAHSDTTAQNVLEQVVSPDDLAAYLVRHGYRGTTYVSKSASSVEHHARTTPYEVSRYMRALWQGTSCTGEVRAFLLSALARSRHTYYGLRHLPCALNTRTPQITAHYTKAGKIHHSVNDTLVLETDRGTLTMSIFVDNLPVQNHLNTVDHEGILLVASLAKEFFDGWYERV